MWTKKPFALSYQVTSPFGPRVHPITHEQSFHKGIDFGMPVGTPLLASYNGVIENGEDDIDGKYVKIKFITPELTRGFFLYCHLSEHTLPNKSKVVTGDQVGLSGNTGHSTGPHLHFQLELMLKKDQYSVVNPMQYVNFA